MSAVGLDDAAKGAEQPAAYAAFSMAQCSSSPEHNPQALPGHYSANGLRKAAEGLEESG